MLMEEDLLALSTLVSKLQIEGYDVATLEEILKKERKKLNERQAEDLKLYFPIKSNVGVRVSEIEYGYRNLRLNVLIELERETGVFDINSKPELFESIIRNTLMQCARNIKAEYIKEVAKLTAGTTPPASSTKTASASNPIVLTIGSNSLQVETGTIDIAVAWQIKKIEDHSGVSLDGTHSATTATASAPIKVTLWDGVSTGTEVTLEAVSGNWDGSSISGASVAITGGV